MKFLQFRAVACTLLTACVLFITSCGSDDEPEPTAEKATLRLRIENIGSDDLPLELNKDYVTEHGDTIQITALQYFLSNVKLMNMESGASQSIPDSYHLIKTTGDGSVTVVEIPELETGDYTSIVFGFGVDSAANHNSATDTGDLDPVGSDGMIWNWDTGYKFIKLEGKYRSDTTTNGSFTFHVGTDANYKTYHLDGTSDEHEGHTKTSNLLLSLESGKTREIHIKANILNIFNHPNVIDLDVTNTAHAGTSTSIAENYGTDLFEVHHSILE